jgi:hypothetical protein
MDKKENHTNKSSKLTRFRSAEEMKATPPAFPSDRPLAQLQAERKLLFDELRSTFSANPARQRKTTNKRSK